MAKTTKTMTARQWKARYYAQPANKVKKADALDHSILKWTGLLLHGNVTGMDINDSTCALCHHYEDMTCDGCPLAKSRGGVRCDRKVDGETRSPFHMWSHWSDAGPMLRALIAAKERQR